MALIMRALIEILRKPAIGDVLSELALFAAPVWLAVFVGLVVGWAWRPRWAAGLVGPGKFSSHAANTMESSHFSVLHLSFPRLDSLRAQLPSCITCLMPELGYDGKETTLDLGSPTQDKVKLDVTLEDLQNLHNLVETTDGGPAWIHMMEKSLPGMSYQAWRRDSESGPPQYRSRTTFDDATPEIVRDFFGDDEFRIKNKWDDMLLFHETLKECSVTGTMLVHWIRKFPFFCSDREYTIGRRLWEVDGDYYCVTKGVPCSSVPRKNRPRRVDLYYSSWRIRAVESRRGDGRRTACEVLLFHHEDMGIPWEIAKLGIRQGMWGCVKKIEPGLRAYQASRKAGEPLSRSAATAQINTKVSSGYLRSQGARSILADGAEEAEQEKPWRGRIPKLLIVGGAVAFACTIDRGLITKAIIFGVARRFAKIRRGL
ncbi:hypothetical protein KSP39_PZI022835 [Platanthera zijinensis]|uniref:START domain-containing protein n=1 Tax=Platanthera zijinensis TaxID=2320716 RepID=A0AAP0FV47_9ASPA